MLNMINKELNSDLKIKKHKISSCVCAKYGNVARCNIFEMRE